MGAVSKHLVMNVPCQALYSVITDFKKYPEFVDEVVNVEVLEANAEYAKVRFELEVIKRFDYVLEFSLRANETVSWKLLSSNFFKINDGKWELKSSNGNKTDVNYTLDVAVGFLVPSWVTKKLTETNLPKMLEGFEKRTVKLHGASA